MTPRALDAEVVHGRLVELRRVLGHLERRRGVDAAALEADLDARYATERMLALLVDLAVAVNNHVVGAVLGRGATDYRESFHLAVEAQALSADLAAELVGSVGLRNVLVHEYLAVDLEIVARSVPTALDGYHRYVTEIAAWLERQVASEQPDSRE